MRKRVPLRERGAALLTVLLLVAVMSIVTAAILERLTIATRLTGNAGVRDQARAYLLATEAFAAARIGDLVTLDPERTTLAGGWNGTERPLPVPGGAGSVRVTDGGNCFNLNSLVSGDEPGNYAARSSAITQFRGLMDVLGVDSRAVTVIANSTADWIDSDSNVRPNGAEDEAYTGAATPYRPANNLMADPSELRAVHGVTPQIYAALQPWICTLPTSTMSPINVNTLLPTQAPLLAMFAPDQLSISTAERVLAARPAGGYGSTEDFWGQRGLDGVSTIQRAQTTIKTRWFAVETQVALGGVVSRETALFDADAKPVRLVRRQWGDAA